MVNSSQSTKSNLTLSIYQQFSNDKTTCSIGRVVSGYRKTRFFEGQKRWNHLFNVIKLYLFKDWSGQLEAQDQKLNIKDGLFCTLSKTSPLITIDIEDELIDVALKEETQKIIISDFDDTIIKSRATSIIRLVFTTLFKPVGKREFFPEVSEVYSKLENGLNKNEKNLFFYISSSTWNIYPLLKGFLDFYLVPKGILLLREMDFGNTFASELKHSHKLKKIQFLLDFYPKIEFILIGDAGQEDAQIYTQIARNNPNRISRIFIRYKWWEKLLADRPIEHKEIEGANLTYFKNLNDIPESDLY